MDTLTWAILIFTAGNAIEWLLRSVLTLRIWRQQFHLTPDYIPENDHPAHKLSVVVAAKDEEENIELCVQSILSQEYSDFELIVVNDRSTDRTAEIIERLAADEPRMTVYHIDELPKGWCGKNHAMQHGITRSSGEWFCMTDADCTLTSKRTLSLTVGRAMETGADMFSMIPSLVLHTFWERLLQPVLGGVLMIWLPPKKVNRPETPHAYANGQYMLMRRDAWEAIGTHEALRESLIEDIELARRIKEAGKRLHVEVSDDLLSTRMYTSRKQIHRGWERIYLGAFHTLWNLTKAFTVLIARGLTPTIMVMIALCVLAAGPKRPNLWQWTLGFAIAGQLLQWATMVQYYRVLKSRWYYGLLYPFACAWIGGIILAAKSKLRKNATITWRDTTYTKDEFRV